ncbi:MAG TPA: alpha-2-macroglobulin family protein, partial [Niastella sp.]
MTIRKLLLVGCAILLTLVTYAQQKLNLYEKEWQKVDSFILKGNLTQSALKVVNSIYSLAKKEGNDVQLIKALLYKAQLQESIADNIRQLEAETANVKEPARSLLQSITAHYYLAWFQQYRRVFYDRTQTVNFKKDDPSTWTSEDFHKKIGELYLASLSNEKLLMQTKLEPFDPIITKGYIWYTTGSQTIFTQDNVRDLRPTLFDLLAHRALEYFENNERDITNAANNFEINDAFAFANAKEFMNHTFTTTDSSSLQFKALQLYQRLLQFHAADTKPDAFIEADIDRVVFVFNNATLENSDALYEKALEQIGNKYGYISPATQAWYLLAQWHADQAEEYKPLQGDANRDAYIKAMRICNKVMVQKDTSEGKLNCQSLVRNITRIELNLETEKVNVPGQPFRTLLNWRNFTQLHFRLVKMDKVTRTALGDNNYREPDWKTLVQLPAIRSFSQVLPAAGDYQWHTTELKIDALPVGEYVLIASVGNNFPLVENQLAVQRFYVSNLAYIQKGADLFVANRETGKPVPHAKVQVLFQTYNNKTEKNGESKGQTVFTNEHGLVTFTKPPPSSDDEHYRFDITTADDHLCIDEYLYSYTYKKTEPQKESITKQAYLFTDRSIYRPGQTVYFKGIVLNQNSRTLNNSIASGFKTTIILSGPNEYEDSLHVTSNEFGAYSGKFKLPVNVLNGDFRITDNLCEDIAFISVEEYKRPKFQVEINKPTGTYRLNEDVTVQGTAKAYAGNVIDGAKVKYRVERKTIMPLWLNKFGTKIWPPYRSEVVEIAHGELTTDAKGTFQIKFKAIPDNKVPKKDQPTFYYTVSADVTDAAGETRNNSTVIAVAWQALQLELNVPEKMHTDSLNKIAVTTTNLNDLFEKAPVTISIHKLKTPDRVFRERYWQQPDTFVLSQNEYYSLFPYDEYKDESKLEKWTKEQKLWEKTDSTIENKPFTISNTTFTPGWYFIEAIAKDKNGEEVKSIQYIQLYNQSSANPQASVFSVSDKLTVEPGEKAVYQVNTTLDDAFIIQDLIQKGDSIQRSFFTLNKATRSFEIPVTEKDRGGFAIQFAFIKHNREYTGELRFDVPWSNKELNISYETFRDKTLPGSEEKWKVKISGLKGDKVAAEMLTAMYDASLDQFNANEWNKPAPWPQFYVDERWSDPNNFTRVYSRETVFDSTESASIIKAYDRLTIDNGKFQYKEYNKYDGDMVLHDGNVVLPAPHFNLRTRRGDGYRNGNGFYAFAISVPDLKNDPDGSKGLMRERAETKIVYDDNQKPEEKRSDVPQGPVQVRKNFNETAFFFPHLHTDADGNIEFAFTMPEALTQWKWLSLAHTKDLAFGVNEKTIITQKDLMVQPNAPRFLREGDRMNFSTKIANLTDKEITGQVQLQLIDATNNQPVDDMFKNIIPNKSVIVPARQSVPVSFSIEIPYQYNKPVTYRLIAKADNISDGEEAMLPVISNRMLVTESLPLPVRGNTTKNFTFEKLVNSGSSETLNHHTLTVEYTSNPAWYAVQALPYLMEYPYECAEQTFNRYYANALAGSIANASPKMKQVFARWKTADTAALLSNLQKNEELKSVLLQETPWVLQAKTEAQQKKNIALLFDMVRMSSEQNKAIAKLQELQSSNGGFVWFKGGTADRYITQYILTGIGHLKKLKALPSNDNINNIVKKALGWLDNRLNEDYTEMLKLKTKPSQDRYLSPLHIQYLYMRSFFPKHPVPVSALKAYTYYRSLLQKNWLNQSHYMQGMIALTLFRAGDVQTARNIVNSLKENALTNEELGMYWKDFTGGYYWYQSTVESQALMIETFNEVTRDSAAVNDMKLW